MRRLAALLLVLLAAGCPDGKTAGTGGPPAPVATPVSATPTAATWSAQADRVAVRLDELVKAVAAGDKKAALEAHDRAYFEEYENEAHNLEVECRQKLDQVKFEGRMTSIVIVRETQFSDIKAAVKAGAPVEKVRELVDALLANIREDAQKLDSVH